MVEIASRVCILLLNTTFLLDKRWQRSLRKFGFFTEPAAVRRDSCRHFLLFVFDDIVFKKRMLDETIARPSLSWIFVKTLLKMIEFEFSLRDWPDERNLKITFKKSIANGF